MVIRANNIPVIIFIVPCQYMLAFLSEIGRDNNYFNKHGWSNCLHNHHMAIQEEMNLNEWVSECVIV